MPTRADGSFPWDCEAARSVGSVRRPLSWTRTLLFLASSVMLGCADDGMAPPTGELPQVVFLAVETDRHDLLPCGEGESCAVPTTARVTQRFTLPVPERRIRGYQWRLQRPGRAPGAWEPSANEADFLPAGRDTVFRDSTGVIRWQLQRDTLAVSFAASLDDTISDLGELLLTARVYTTIPAEDLVESTRHYAVFESPLPRLRFLDVMPLEDGLLPCQVAQGCTIPALTDFRVRFTALSEHDWIEGFTWQVEAPVWLPAFTLDNTLFYPADRDTIAEDWALENSIVSVDIRPFDPSWIQPLRIPAGLYRFLARVRDDAFRVDQGAASVHLGYPPDTRLYEIGRCDCPSPPPGCDALDNAPIGWVTAVAAKQLAVDEWIPFCPGDTIPQRSTVRFYARGWDDARDHGLDPGGPAEVRYRFRAEFQRGDFVSVNEPYSSPAVAAADLPLPGGGSFRGGSVELWADCALDYAVQASAVDELGTLDAAPPVLPFYVGGAPTLDSLQIRPVILFVPDDSMSPFPRDVPLQQSDFGPDTLLVMGHAVADDPKDPQTPLGLGYNDFELPLKAWGHDHPRDRNGPGRQWYVSEQEGRIRAWWVRFDCTEPGCTDLVLPGEGIWQPDVSRFTDPSGSQVFDEGLTVRIPLDTLCLSAPCRSDSIRLRLQPRLLGDYEYTIQGRDTESFPVYCFYPSDLGPFHTNFRLNISPLGLTTERISRQVHWRQRVDVRPPKVANDSDTPRWISR